MKKVVRIVVVVLLLTAAGSISRSAMGPDPMPLCYPNPCPNT